MQAFLVGGAVRDRLLGIAVVDRDWVVVGSTPEAMEEAGYKQVGRDFPVFLHPDSHEEYALARTERKTAPGYTGFKVHAAPDVTLEEDLQRRDLTINAIAETADGEHIDPFNGIEDIRQRILRHVSPAFAEDPVRILRVARFAARLKPFGFSVAPETLSLMRNMTESGETDALVPERVWAEVQSALYTTHPQEFFMVLRESGALQSVIVELDALFGVPQVAEYHPEIDSGVHTMMVVEQARDIARQAYAVSESSESAAAKNLQAQVVFAAVCHDLGKALTPDDLLPSHHGHEERGVAVVEQLCTRLRVPKDFRDLAILTCRHHLRCHRATELKPTTLVKTIAALDGIRKPERYRQFLLACEADYFGRGSGKKTDRAPYVQAEYMLEALQAICSVDAAAIASAQEDKSKIKSALYEARVTAVKQWLTVRATRKDS